MTKITTDFVGSETIAVTKQRLTDILAYWGASTAAYTTWGQARTALNALLTSTTAGTIGSTELAGSFLPKINFLNDPDEMIADALFGAGEQGVWLDPSDLTTMYQDAAGTVPVYAPGQPVGLRLDKSKGLVLGPELVTNGDFAAGTTGWTTFALVDLVVTSGQATISRYADSTAADFPRQAIISAGKWYEVSFSVLARSNSVSVYVGGTEYAVSSTGSYVVKLLAGSDGLGFRIGPTGFATATCTVDNISVKELPGNHATQSTAGSRPMYGIEPKGGRRNLLLATDTLATQSLTVTAAAHTLAFTGTGTVTLSGASTAGPLVGTGAGNRVSLTFTPTAASLTLTVSGSVTLAQLELGSSATNYQKVVTAFDVTEAGVNTCHYCQYDGSDDGMVTNSIDFTATDKMSVFAGVRRNTASPSATSVILELSADRSSNNGAWTFVGPVNAPPLAYVFASKGTVNSSAEDSTVYAIPHQAVTTGISDISGDLVTLRLNGTQIAQNTSDQGTGNFGNYPLYIGRRNNATLPFNGKDYGIIVTGKLANATAIATTEMWLANKTPGVTL